MPNLITISLSVKPAVQKYLQFHHGSSTIYVKRRSSTHKMLCRNLMPHNYKKIFINRYPNQVRFVMTDQYIRSLDPRSRFLYFDENAVIELNQYFMKRLKIELITFLDGYMVFGDEIQHGILLFMQKYNLSDADLSFEALKKEFYRYRLRSNLLKAS